MRPALEQKVVARWTDWFHMHGDLRRTLMPYGLQCGDGWFDLVWRLCERLEPVVSELNEVLPDDDRFEVLEVKQKIGTLRFYVSHHSAAIDAEIEATRLESLRTCEYCGRPGSLRNTDGCLATLCGECLQAGVYGSGS